MTAWRPDEPVFIAGYTLKPAEAWLQCFTQEYSKLSRGDAHREHLADWAIDLLPSNAGRDPVEFAREEFEQARGPISSA